MTAKQNARALLCALLFVGELLLAGSLSSQGMRGTIRKESFGKAASGEQIDLYTLSNEKGLEVAITNFGATVVVLKVPDRTGKAADVVLGFDTLQGYENGTAYFGATVGRYGNRIGGGKFSIDQSRIFRPRCDSHIFPPSRRSKPSRSHSLAAYRTPTQHPPPSRFGREPSAQPP